MRKKLLSILLIALTITTIILSSATAFAYDVRVVKVGVCHVSGFAEKTAMASYSGYAIEYLKSIQKRTNMIFEFVEYENLDETINALANEKVDLVMGVEQDYIQENVEEYIYSKHPMATTHNSIYVLDTNEKYFYADHENFNNITIGAVKNDPKIKKLQLHSYEEKFVYKLSLYDSESEMLEAFQNEEVEAFLGDDFYKMTNERTIDDFGLNNLYFVGTQNSKEIIKTINKEMEQILISNPTFNHEIYEKFFEEAKSKAPPLTYDEQQYLENCDTITVRYSPFLAPLSYEGEKGVSGIGVDYVKLISEKIHINFRFKQEVKENLFKKSNENFLISHIYNSENLLKSYNLKASDVYLDVPVVLLGLKKADEKQSGKTVVIYAQDVNMQYYLAEKYPYLTPLFVDNIDSAFTAVLTGKADYTIQYSYIVNDYLQSLKPEVMETLTSSYNFMPVSIGMSEQTDEKLENIINKSINSILLQERDNIILLNTIDSPYKQTLTTMLKKYFPVVIIATFAILLVFIASVALSKYRLLKVAYTDTLTGCDNYTKFLKNVNTQLDRSSDKYAIISLDINNFKIINDTMGRDDGDAILIQLSIALKQGLEKGEFVARNNADNFVLLIKMDSKEGILHRIRKFTKNLVLTSTVTQRAIRTPQFCVGIYIIEASDKDVCTMISNADLARKNTKSEHSSSYAFYDRDMHQKILQDKNLENSLASSLEKGEFEVYLQPKYMITTRKIVGAEALIRWNHPQKGLLPPGKFINICEKTGFIVDLDFFVYEKVFEILDNWVKQGVRTVPISVNVSRLHLQDPNFVNNFCAIADRYNAVEHSLIECELTETLFSEDINLLNTVVKSIKNKGFSVSIDDFGSGYSSLNMLKEIQVDMLKLDRDFFSQDEELPREKVVLQNIVRMAKELDMTVICEGVETEKQAEFLKSVECDMGQGYLFARPAPIKIMEDMLKKGM